MTQLILVLEENPGIQGVIAASLLNSNITVTQELLPDLFVQQVQNLKPDLILLSNSDSAQNYQTCREIRNDPQFKQTPIILLANAKDEIEESLLAELEVEALLRKPFESTRLKEQLSRYIVLDENFGTEPENIDLNLALDMSSIDEQLKDIDLVEDEEASSEVEENPAATGLDQTTEELDSVLSSGSKMDSLLLDEIDENKDQTATDDVLEVDETEMRFEGLEELNDDEIEMDSDLEFELQLDEDEVEENTQDEESEISTTVTESHLVGLEQLKNSGLEDQYAERYLKNSNEVSAQNSRSELENIKLELNDFEDPDDIWMKTPDLDQKLREGLTDISLDEADVQSEFSKNRTSFEGLAELTLQDAESINSEKLLQFQNMDNFEMQLLAEDTSQELENKLDDKLLTDSEEQDLEEIEDAEQFILETSAAELDDDLSENRGELEIKSMVEESFDEEVISEEDALEELEELSEQMEALELEEAEFEAEEKEYEDELEIEKLETEALLGGGETGEIDDSEGELVEFMLDELGDLLEDDLEPETEESLAMSAAFEEEVFESWDHAEEAFMGFERESESPEKETTQEVPEIETFESSKVDAEEDEDDEETEKSESYSFTENELKEIVTISVQKALEKSIASSLVELAVTEIKTQVSRTD
ncbi:MAG: response regulator [SAR324 cluster bacterium]|nr:response regulator [SAR324 cluster bacterium]MBL7034384.1 response regulator [SAR324 cluster bacterium]